MSILDHVRSEAAPKTTRMPFGNTTNPTDRPKAKVWMNVGREVGGKFITIAGAGTPIDTTEPLPIRGQNEDFIKQVTAQNGFLASLQGLGASLTPGQEVVLNLQVRLRRVNDEVVIDPTENEYAIDASTLLVQAPAANLLAAE